MARQNLTKEEIIAKFAAGLNCGQCTLTPWAEELGYDYEELLRVAGSFGGGCFRGDTCGAVIGALIAIGMKYGGTYSEEDSAIVHEKVHAFHDAFIERFGATSCRELLKYDFSKPGEKDKAVESGIMMEACPMFVLGALEILDGIMD
ncbi:MAG: C_GCAxxG_C_C family protein [Oscillospiraceae bacterium]|nr:C_GCAxxG_C_C family protein [Oscillospiraceae bacterium]MBR5262041.1 C_GCAxxG_C_C family protein [Oscillospiraceae bacterium]